MKYILWVVALLEACDITNNGHYLGFYQEFEIRLKPQEMVIFYAKSLHFEWTLTGGSPDAYKMQSLPKTIPDDACNFDEA